MMTRILTTIGTDYREWIGVSAVLSGLIVVAIDYAQGDRLFATILLGALTVSLAVLLWWTRRRSRGPHRDHAAAKEAAGKDELIVYWRPGCIYCDRLKLSLGSARHDLIWVNLSRDPEAVAFVTSIHGGDETVPTVTTGTGRVLAPTATAIRAHIASTRDHVRHPSPATEAALS